MTAELEAPSETTGSSRVTEPSSESLDEHGIEHGDEHRDGYGDVDVELANRYIEAVLRREPASYGTERFLNRELSWLLFGARILDLAEEPGLPLLERVKFIAILATGVDEFLQVRVAGLKDQFAAGFRGRSPDGRSVAQQLAEIRQGLKSLIKRTGEVFNVQLRPALEAAGIRIVDHVSLDESARDELHRIFDDEIFPVLTPLAVDPGHPFPYISNLSLNLAVVVEDPVNGDRRFARVKIPPLLPRFVPLGDGERYVPLEQVISAHLDELFPDMAVGARHTFRVVRNADLALDEGEADDLLEAVEVELRRRRFGKAVSLEIDEGAGADVRNLLLRELELGPEDCYTSVAPLDLGALWTMAAMDRPDLKVPNWTPSTQPRLATPDGDEVDLFAVLRERDVLVQHPYDSFATSVEAFISQAASDPDVLAIKQTLYRTSGDTPFVAALARAAESGKQVAALVELKARFDEQRNIVWARQLEQAGVHVVYGVVGLKTHSKTALVVRREPDGIRRYCHVGTGNYNSGTARIYEDIGLLSSSPALGADLTDLFNHLTGFSRPSRTRSLILAPERFRPWVLEEIAAQTAAGSAGRIAIKVNGLTDPEIIDALYVASQESVRIELLVRSVCSLRPGIEGLSTGIRVRSIVGRFLEHSRIFRFGAPDPKAPDSMELASARGATGQLDADERAALAGVAEVGRRSTGAARYFIGSADLMERNLDRRIEAVVPVTDPDLCSRLEGILALDLADDLSSWELGSDGEWRRVEVTHGLKAQERFAAIAVERGRRRRSPDSL